MTARDPISLLVQEGYITAAQLQDAKDKQRGAKRPLHEILIEMGLVGEDAFFTVVASAVSVPVFDPQTATSPEVLSLVPCDVARRCGAFPFRREGEVLCVAMTNPADLMAKDDIAAATGLVVKPFLAKKSQIDTCIVEHYNLDDSVYDLLKNTVNDSKIELVNEEGDHGRPLNVDAFQDESSPVVKLVSLLLGDAVKMRATDIHVEPQEECVSVRYRIDGNLKNVLKVPRELHARLSARIKILAGLDVAESRKAQDGRIKIVVNGRKIDLRISLIPTYYGEKIAIRLLDQNEARTALDRIGFMPSERERFCDALQKPQGMILVTGPTGSGKTTTLYAALNFIKNETKHIITIEDPVEYVVEGINQIQLNPAKDVTFASSLRGILRQDPNVIFVGEIRDRETADIAFRSAQTGHLVLSTVHTNTAVSSITRLVDIGLEPYLIASSLLMVVAQRLVRIICPQCKEAYVPDEAVLERIRPFFPTVDEVLFYRGVGCDQCHFSGFLGRTGVFEIMAVTEEIRGLINAKATEDQILQAAKRAGLQSLATAVMAKVVTGITSIDEAARIVDIGLAESGHVQGKSSSSQSVPVHAEAPVSAVLPAAAEQKKQHMILIVDDEEDLVRILKRRVSDAGYAVLTAGNGSEALALAFKDQPDLIIMDVNMPVMDGFAATRALRAQLATASIPIILLTARQDPGSEVTGLDAGADDYVTKPYESTALLARVKMLLRRR